MEEEILKLILAEMREMKGDISDLKKDMTEVKDRLTNLESDMSEVKSDIVELKTDMSEVKSDIVELKSDMVEVKSTLQETKELAEFNKETSDSIKNVVTSHYMEFKKFVKSNATQHNLYNAKLLKYNKEN